MPENHSLTLFAHSRTLFLQSVNFPVIPLISPATMLLPISANTVDGECIPNIFLTISVMVLKQSSAVCNGAGRQALVMPLSKPPTIFSPTVFISPSSDPIPNFFDIPSTTLVFSSFQMAVHDTHLNIFLNVHFAANTLKTVLRIVSQSISDIAVPTPFRSSYQSTSSIKVLISVHTPDIRELIVPPASFQSIVLTALFIALAKSLPIFLKSIFARNFPRPLKSVLMLLPSVVPTRFQSISVIAVFIFVPSPSQKESNPSLMVFQSSFFSAVLTPLAKFVAMSFHGKVFEKFSTAVNMPFTNPANVSPMPT